MRAIFARIHTTLRRMSRPTARILATLELLQSHRITGAELATRLGVDARTVRRYITALADMGIPVMAERGRDGAYTLARGFRLPPMMFTNDEAMALSVGLIAARQIRGGATPEALASAQAKLARALPEVLRKRVNALDETLALDTRVSHASAPPELIATLAEAGGRGQTVLIQYQAPGVAATTRHFNPYAIAHYLGRWYAVGWCHLRRQVRSFRLDRIESAESIAASFARPAGFDALAYLKHSVATLPRQHSVAVWIDAPPAAVQTQVVAELGVLEVAGKGTRLLSEVDDIHWFARELSRLSFSFTIENTPAAVALKRALKAHAAKLQAVATESM
jgi:predicted DNA-binding transcriptional regulator YafY